jgi:hypothetical protein
MGCLYSVHHFNTGEVLPAGRSQTTLGAGRQPIWHCGHEAADSAASHVCGDSAGEAATQTHVFKGSVDFRLGLKDSLGPFPGAELQWHLEAPTNPATMEFGVNLGLPGGAAFRHEVGVGWGIGAWADNSFYLQYSASRPVGGPLLFGNLRVTWLATQIGEVLGDDFTQPLPSNRHLVLQAGAGLFLRLPDWVVVPDFLIPQVNLTLPQIPSGEKKFRGGDIPSGQWDANLGFGWAF